MKLPVAGQQMSPLLTLLSPTHKKETHSYNLPTIAIHHAT
jgi:hypothetical protein